jgi:hypothetical protein
MSRKIHAYFEPYEFTLAHHWACPIEYGDDSGMSDEESRQLESFLRSVETDCGPGHWVWPDDEEDNFTRDEITGLRANCVNAVYMAQRMSPIMVEPLPSSPAGSPLAYLNPHDILAVKTAELPYWAQNRDSQGYGRAVRTDHMVQLYDKRWRRIYVCLCGNSGSAYVRVKGAWWFIGSEAETCIEKLQRKGD